jgi:hypothetical protein
MATVAQKYGLPRFIAQAQSCEIEGWVATASDADIMLELKLQASIMEDMPAYARLSVMLKEELALRASLRKLGTAYGRVA